MTNELETIRVFVGTDATQIVAHQVLAYSLRKHTQREVAVYPMRDLPLPTPRDLDNRSRTGFSFYRFTIPRQCGYRGRAIYLDPDTLVFGDIAELWDTAMGENLVMCTRQSHTPEAFKDHPGFHQGPQFSVMLLDCARLDWDIEHIVAQLDAGTFSYRQLMHEMCLVPAERLSSDLPPEWNHLEEYHHGATKLLHYTVVPTQPWRCRENPLGPLWRSCYREAVRAGAVDLVAVLEGIERGFVLPELADDLAPPIRRLWDRHQSEIEALRAELSNVLQSQTQLTSERDSLGARATELAEDLRALRNTWSWRLGHALTRPAAQIKHLFHDVLSSQRS